MNINNLILAPNTPAYNIVKRLSDGVIQNGVTGGKFTVHSILMSDIYFCAICASAVNVLMVMMSPPPPSVTICSLLIVYLLSLD